MDSVGNQTDLLSVSSFETAKKEEHNDLVEKRQIRQKTKDSFQTSSTEIHHGKDNNVKGEKQLTRISGRDEPESEQNESKTTKKTTKTSKNRHEINEEVKQDETKNINNQRETLEYNPNDKFGDFKTVTDENGKEEKDMQEVREPQANKSSLRTKQEQFQTSHIRMEEIQWQRLLERKLNRETKDREFEQRYRDEIKTQIREIEKQKKTDSLLLKKRMAEYEKRRRSNNYAFCRMLQRKDKDYRAENEALVQKIIEIDKQKQRNVEKLKARVSYLEERKIKEQDAFLQRMQELERRREEEYERSQKRLEVIEKRKYNERKAWLLQVQKVDGLRKEVFKKSVQSLDMTCENGNMTKESQTDCQKTDKTVQKNIKDQARIMEDISQVTSPRNVFLPKLHHKRGMVGRHKSEAAKTKHKKPKTHDVNEQPHEDFIQKDPDDLRIGVPVSN